MSDNEEWEEISEEQADKELQESACSICGKTLKQRMEEGYEFDPEDKMINPSCKWHSPLCPVCDDLLEQKLVDSIDEDDEWFLLVIERVLRKINVKLELKQESIDESE